MISVFEGRGARYCIGELFVMVYAKYYSKYNLKLFCAEEHDDEFQSTNASHNLKLNMKIVNIIFSLQ